MTYKQKKSISYSSGGWGVQDQGTGNLVTGKGLLPGSQKGVFLAVSSQGGLGEGTLRNLFHESHGLITSPKALLPNTIILGVGFQQMHFGGGHKYSVL